MAKPDRHERGTARFCAGVPATLHWQGATLPCRAENLSRSGALLEGKLPTTAGPSIEVTLSSVAGDLSVRLPAEIRRIGSDDEGRLIQLGLQFGEITAAAAETLELLVARVIEGVTPAMLGMLPPNPTLRQVRDALERVPVAHRSALAVRGTARDRELLFQDGDPRVLDALARNPNLTPPEFRALLRIRKLLPRTLQQLARDSRWISSEEFKVMIACHPNTSFDVADRLIEGLSPGGQKKALLTPGLNPVLRAKLAQKGRRRVLR